MKEAEMQDLDTLQKRRSAGGIPTTRAALRRHEHYVLKSDFKCDEVLRPGAESVAIVNAIPVFLRKDLSTARSSEQWCRLGRQVLQHEKPAKLMQLPKSEIRCELFGEWQTEAILTERSPAASRRRKAVFSASTNESGQKKSKRVGKPPVSVRSFSVHVQKLGQWIADRGFLPWEGADNADERSLARWVCKMRAFRALGRLSEVEVEQLQSLDGWDWGPDADIPCTGHDEEKQPKDESEQDTWQQWSKLTLERLSAELNRQTSATERRSRLRCWQRAYHPDKNPGREHEVMPVFRWVQDLWDKMFKSSAEGGVLPTKSATASAAATVVVSPSASTPPTRHPCRLKCAPTSDSSEAKNSR